MKTFLLNLLSLCYLKVNYIFQCAYLKDKQARYVKSYTYIYYIIIISICLYFYMCLIIHYILPEFYGVEMVSFREIIGDKLNTDYLEKLTSTAEDQKRDIEDKSSDFLLYTLTTKLLDLFVDHKGNTLNSYIEVEELKNTFYMNKKLSEHVLELPTTENKAVLLFIEYLLDATQKLEYANRNNE